MEGFTAFRDKVVVEFGDDDLFVLTGPTGSGKSSVIDAIVFALYGSVPRYAKLNLVAPAITQGKTEARVRLDFVAAGRKLTAVRVVRRTKDGGATTKEARLEEGDTVLAGNAKELTLRVESLLGLNFAQFTTCVVLPQGEFARFLFADGRDRQALLVRLLGLGVYGRMGKEARDRAKVASAKAEVYEGQLAELETIDAAARDRAGARVTALSELADEIDKARAELADLAKRAAESAEEAQRLAGLVTSLDAIELPADVEKLAAAIDAARNALDVARNTTASVDATLVAAQAARDELGERTTLEQARRDRAAHTEQAQRREGELTQEERAELDERAAWKEQEAADTEQGAAAEEREAARRAHAAHDLAADLEAGQDCPICQRVLEHAPNLETPAAMTAADRRMQRAESTRRRAGERHRAAADVLSRTTEAVKARKERLAELDERLADAPAAEEIDQKLETIGAAEKTLATVTAEVRACRTAEDDARTRLDRAAATVGDAWTEFDRTRDAVAALEPPRPDRTDLGGSWRALSGWARERVPATRERALELAGAASDVDGARRERLEHLRKRCATLDVSAGDAPWDVVGRALAAARAELARIEDALGRTQRLRDSLTTERAAADVAAAVGRHLRTDGFERWLLEAAFERLVFGASTVLRELSSGGYSFAVDDKLNFEVIDHRNADERRSARTLSGGETFLASLALALTLADQVAELAASGAAPLDSIFLDEGFGSLDADTLDVVHAAIEELGARGRAVGLITHVRELAERIPVQYRVRKGPATSTVEKVVL